MKKTVRLLALLLALVLASAFLAACGDGDGETTTAPTTTAKPSGSTPGGPSTPDATEKLTQDWESLNFSDTSVRILYNNYITSAMTDAGAGSSLLYMKGPDDYSGASRGDYKAAYERHRRVADALDLVPGETLIYNTRTQWDGKCDDIISKDIKPLIEADSDENPTIIIHQNYGMVRAGILGYLFNALDTDEDNYFDLTHENWYLDMMEENTIDTSEIYMLMGDYTIDQLRFGFGTLVNTGIADDSLSMFDGLDYIYELVENKAWTYDAMMELARAASNADSGATGDNLLMGAISDQWTVRNYFASSGLDIFKRDANGEAFYIQGAEIDPIHDWVDKLISMEKEAYFSYNWAADVSINPSKTSPATTFVNGGSLFALSQMILTLEGNLVQNMDTPAGILPNPLYVPNDSTDVADLEYKSLVSDNANSAGILYTSEAREFTAASAFLQMMTETSNAFYRQYFVEGLQNRNNSIGAEHKKMLETIRAGLCSPMSFYYDNYCAKEINLDTYGKIMYKSIDAGTNTFSSDWAVDIDAKVRNWETLKNNYGH